MRTTLICAMMSLLIFACGPSASDYTLAAKELCSCISNAEATAEAPSKHVLIYAKCSADVEEQHSISIEDAAFEQAMKEHCVEWLGLHQMVMSKIIGTLDYE
jgi:phosphosulfolactate phosphohydrolase-like enzyme